MQNRLPGQAIGANTENYSRDSADLASVESHLKRVATPGNGLTTQSGRDMKIGVVEKDELHRKELVWGLARFGFGVRGFDGPRQLYLGLLQESACIVVIGSGLAENDSLSVIQQLKTIGHPGVVALIAENDHQTRVRIMQEGADACLSAPVQISELASILLAIQRRLAGPRAPASPTPPPPRQIAKRGGTDTPHVGGWALSDDGWILEVPNGQRIALSPSERLLMRELLTKANATITRDELMRVLGHRHDFHLSHRLDVLLSRLRGKIRKETGLRLPLQAVRSIGFLFSPD